jgi:hypothetical protein
MLELRRELGLDPPAQLLGRVEDVVHEMGRGTFRSVLQGRQAGSQLVHPMVCIQSGGVVLAETRCNEITVAAMLDEICKIEVRQAGCGLAGEPCGLEVLVGWVIGPEDKNVQGRD